MRKIVLLIYLLSLILTFNVQASTGLSNQCSSVLNDYIYPDTFRYRFLLQFKDKQIEALKNAELKLKDLKAKGMIGHDEANRIKEQIEIVMTASEDFNTRLSKGLPVQRSAKRKLTIETGEINFRLLAYDPVAQFNQLEEEVEFLKSLSKKINLEKDRLSVFSKAALSRADIKINRLDEEMNRLLRQLFSDEKTALPEIMVMKEKLSEILLKLSEII